MTLDRFTIPGGSISTFIALAPPAGVLKPAGGVADKVSVVSEVTLPAMKQVEPWPSTAAPLRPQCPLQR